MAVPGTFILIPFGLSALVAMILAFAGVNLVFQWLVFVANEGRTYPPPGDSHRSRGASSSMRSMKATQRRIFSLFAISKS
jgi:hypothetical protein